MTSTTTPTMPTSLEILTSRLDRLRAERAQVMGESLLESAGDAADRATNVEATIRRQLLDERIAALEVEIAESRHRPHPDGVVSIGDVVTLDFGDGDDTYLIGSVEQAMGGIETVTPGSPLGRALIGASVGTTIDYEPRRGTALQVRVVSVGATAPQSD